MHALCCCVDDRCVGRGQVSERTRALRRGGGRRGRVFVTPAGAAGKGRPCAQAYIMQSSAARHAGRRACSAPSTAAQPPQLPLPLLAPSAAAAAHAAAANQPPPPASRVLYLLLGLLLGLGLVRLGALGGWLLQGGLALEAVCLAAGPAGDRETRQGAGAGIRGEAGQASSSASLHEQSAFDGSADHCQRDRESCRRLALAV